MTTSPKKPEFETPDQMLQRILRPVAAKLLANDPLLLFDAASGSMINASEAALFALGLDLSLPLQPTFAEVMTNSGEDVESLWAALVGGEMRQWSGVLTGALDLPNRSWRHPLRQAARRMRSCRL